MSEDKVKKETIDEAIARIMEEKHFPSLFAIVKDTNLQTEEDVRTEIDKYVRQAYKETPCILSNPAREKLAEECMARGHYHNALNFYVTATAEFTNSRFAAELARFEESKEYDHALALLKVMKEVGMKEI